MADGRIFRDQEKFSDQVARGVASAVDDIRHKVVEEPWYGRETTGSIELINNSADQAADRDKEMASFYGIDQGPEGAAKDAAPEPPAPEPGWEKDEGMER